MKEQGGLSEHVRLGHIRKAIKSQSIRLPVLDENFKEQFSKERSRLVEHGF